MTKTKFNPDPRFLPDLAADPSAEVIAAHDRAVELADQLHHAGEDRQQARLAERSAPTRDVETARKAVEDGKKIPPPSGPSSRAAAEDADRRVATLRQLAGEAQVALTRTLAAEADELVEPQREEVTNRLADVVGLLDQLQPAFDALAQAAGTERGLRQLRQPKNRGLNEFSPLRLKGTTKAGTSDAHELLAALRRSAEESPARLIPLREQILDAVGDGRTSWDDVARRIGRNKIDSDLCQVRGLLLEEGLLTYVTPDGFPASGRGGFGVSIAASDRRLERVAPPSGQRQRKVAA